MPDISWEENETGEASDIVEFFKNKNVLITGGSGYIGTLIIEKLLRTCPNLGKMYVFMRAKKGKSPEQRFEEHFADPVYDRLKEEQPNYAKKLVMIKSDVSLAGLDLSPEDREKIQDTNVIFHGAASVNFKINLSHAANINVRGTKQILSFAKELPELKAFVYISTAFANCQLKSIDEKFLPPPMDSDKFLTFLNVVDEATLEEITPSIIGAFPNVYVFTKAIAEDAVRKEAAELPICIVRPSIVAPTAKEPIPGWTSKTYSAALFCSGVYCGILRTVLFDFKGVANIIPGDYVVANIIAAAWNIAQNKGSGSLNILDAENTDINYEEANNCNAGNLKVKNSSLTSLQSDDKRANDTCKIPIYNSDSSQRNSITWGEFAHFILVNAKHMSSKSIVWHPMLILNKSHYRYYIQTFFLHLVPASIIDAVLTLTGRKPMWLDMYKKLHKWIILYSDCVKHERKLKDENVMELWKKLNQTDRTLFNFNITALDWTSYFQDHSRGIVKYILKDQIEPQTRIFTKRFKLTIAHYITVVIFWTFLVWCVLKLLG